MPTMSEEIIKWEPFPDTGQITTAVVTGEHPFNVPGFHTLFRSLPDVAYYPQHMDQFVADWGNVRTRYDVVLLFNWHLDTPPGNERGWWQSGTKEALEQLGETKQGIVVLHHAIAAFPQWEFWSELVGIPHESRTFTFDQVPDAIVFGETLHIEIADPEYPISRGLSALDIYGETWGFFAGPPGPGCHTLLTTDHPKMRMKAMAWTHQFRNARVFCLQPGHNNDTWADPNFRTVLSRGIQWVAGRL
ncbi:MAG: ThuA domain-containing protein [Anaerolineae bacterium]